MNETKSIIRGESKLKSSRLSYREWARLTVALGVVVFVLWLSVFLYLLF